jgi:hypothetical protein
MSQKILAILAIAALAACGSDNSITHSPEVAKVQAILDHGGYSRLCLVPGDSIKGEHALVKAGLLTVTTTPAHYVSGVWYRYIVPAVYSYQVTEIKGTDYAVASVTSGIPAEFCGAREIVASAATVHRSTANGSSYIQYFVEDRDQAAWVNQVRNYYSPLNRQLANPATGCGMLLNAMGAVVSDSCHHALGGASF